jgi:hypothetical protein
MLLAEVCKEVVRHFGKIKVSLPRGKVDVGRRQGEDFHVDSKAIHIRKPLLNAHMLGSDPQETGTLLPHDFYSAFVRHKFKTMAPPLFKLLQVPRWIEMVVKIDLHPVSPFLLRIDLLIFHSCQKINPFDSPSEAWVMLRVDTERRFSIRPEGWGLEPSKYQRDDLRLMIL